MNWLDVVILVLITLSAVLSLLRGFVREAMSLTAWILAFWFALSFAQPIANHSFLVEHVNSPTVRTIMAFATLFLLVLAAGTVLGHLVGKLVDKTGMSSTDRTMGGVFGVARGIVLVGVVVLVAGMTQLPREPWWQGSLLMNHFEDLALWMERFLPADAQVELDFDPRG